MSRSSHICAVIASLLSLFAVSDAFATRPPSVPTGVNKPWELDAWCTNPNRPERADLEACDRESRGSYWQSWCAVGNRLQSERCAGHFARETALAPAQPQQPDSQAPVITNGNVGAELPPTPQEIQQAEAQRERDEERQGRLAAEREARQLRQSLETQQERNERVAREAREARERADQLDARRVELEGDNTELNNTVEQQQTQFQELWNRNRQTIIIAGAVAASLFIIAVLAWWLFFRKSGELSETDRRLQSETRRSRELRSRVPPDPVDTWVLEGEDSSRGMRVKLPGAKLPEGAGGVRIGRSPEHADAVLAKPEISRAHARFFARGVDLYAEDLGSKNGTSVRDETLTRGDRKLVYDGDMVDLGPYRFRLVKVA